MTPSQKNEKALAALQGKLKTIEEMARQKKQSDGADGDFEFAYDWFCDESRDVLVAVQEAIAALSQPTTGECVGELAILEELKLWLTEPWGEDREFKETTIYNRSFDFDEIKSLAKRLSTPVGGEVMTAPSFTINYTEGLVVLPREDMTPELTREMDALIQSRVGGGGDGSSNICI